MTRLEYRPHKYQWEFHQSNARFRTLIAGRRGGKTLAGTIEALKYANSHPNSNGWIVSPTYRMLEDINIPEIRKWLPQKSIQNWSKQNNQITLINNAKISFRSADTPDRLRGVGLDWLWLDEACYMDKYTWEVLYPALTDKRGIAWITTTPNGEDWVFNEFWKNQGKDYWTRQYKTIDNPYIDKDLVTKAKERMSSQMFRQEYEASFEKFAGLVYPDFNNGHIIDPRGLRWGDAIYFVGVDIGWRKPTVFLLLEWDGEKLTAADEIVKIQTEVEEIAREVLERWKDYPIEFFVADPSCFSTTANSPESIATQYGNFGISFIRANNDVRAGIDKVTALIRTECLRVCSNCDNLIKEFNKYTWKIEREGVELDEKPVKLNDHSLDALRYGVMSSYEGLMLPTQKNGNVYYEADGYEEVEDISYDNLI